MLQEQGNKDTILVRTREAVEKGEQVPTGFAITNKVLLYKGRYVRECQVERVSCRAIEDIYDWQERATGRECEDKSRGMSGNAKFVNNLRLRIKAS